MNGRYLLDTSIVIALFARDLSAVDHLREVEEVFVSSVVIGELYYGAKQSTRVTENLAQIDTFAAGTKVLGCDIETARAYAVIKNQLRRKGRPIPENDIWIAATAQQYGLTAVSRDLPFSEVETLPVEAW